MNSRVSSNPSFKFIEQQLPAEQLARNSKILSRKQLQKRIQGLSEQQYVKITNNLSVQNKRLKVQVTMLHGKVEDLMASKKIKKTEKNPQIQQQILKHKRQLQLKYQSMNYLKGEIHKQHRQEMADDLIVQQKQFQNGLKVVDKETVQLEKQRKKLHKLLRINQADMDSYSNPDSNVEVQNKIQSFKLDNKDLKQEISEIHELMKRKQQDSKIYINRYYNLKKTEERQIKSVFESRALKKSQKTIKEIKLISLSQLKILEKDIQELKKRKKQTEKDLVGERIHKEARKIKFEKEIRQKLDYHKDLFKKRVKALNQLNLLEKHDKDYNEYLLQKANQQAIETIDGSAQTEKFYAKQFRKDWIGTVTGPRFDDSKAMEYRGQTHIRAVTVFLTKEYIVFVKFLYESPGKRKYESQALNESTLQKKCESKRLMARSNGHLINLSISITQKKITKIDFKWSDGETSSQGWDNDNSTRYQFDIDVGGQERPISMFGSVSYQGKNLYALESLGCQIFEEDS